MKPEIIRQLLELNASFYQTFAPEFTATRQRIQPGVLKIVEKYGRPSGGGFGSEKILDLGCGNGELAAYLLRNGFQGAYDGLDFSSDLLEFARKTVQTASLDSPGTASIHLKTANLADPELDTYLPAGRFDLVFCFAVLHHLPGRQNRRDLLKKVGARIKQGGYFIHSEWQFRHSARWLKRILPWEQVGLTENDLEPGDTLLDWRATGDKDAPGLRYVHYFTEGELGEDARACGFRIAETFY